MRSIAALLVTPALVAALTTPAVAQYSHLEWPPRFTLSEAAPGVMVAMEPDNPTEVVHGNTIFILGDSSVIVFDANANRRAAESAIALLRGITPAPVSHLVFSHWHFDHVLGASAYVADSPGLELIAHDSTAIDIRERVVARHNPLVEAAGAALRTDDSVFQAGVDRAGQPMGAEERAYYAMRLDALRYRYEGWAQATYHPPTTSFSSSMTLYQGERRVDVLYLGRANTRGDALVWLPAERVVATGDILVYPVPYPWGSFPSDWVRTLDRIEALDPAVIVPGHGPIMRDLSYLRLVRSWLQSIIAQTRDAVARGLTLEQTMEAVNLDELRQQFTRGESDLELAWQQVVPPAIQRGYLEAKGEL